MRQARFSPGRAGLSMSPFFAVRTVPSTSAPSGALESDWLRINTQAACTRISLTFDDDVLSISHAVVDVVTAVDYIISLGAVRGRDGVVSCAPR